MRIITDIAKLRKALTAARRKGKRIGFVPTMGCLHEGHLSLMDACRRENGLTVVSIFVNPAQFSPTEDFAAYPRQKKRDVLLAKKRNVDIIFYPSIKTIYPKRYLTYIDVKKITQTLCGHSRPKHFRGVTTVVAKLLNIVLPDVLYLGQKDAQQCVVIRQMTTDLNFPVQVKVLPTVREKDGLAMSSRNAYLTPKQRREATVLYRSLRQARQQVARGERRAATVTKNIRRLIRQDSKGRIEYVACVAADTLEPVKTLKGHILIALAVRFGKARLIDNIFLHV